MVKKLVKYTIVLAVIGFLAYQSVYVEKLSKVKAGQSGKFDAAAYAKQLWTDKMPARIQEAAELSVLLTSLQQRKEETFAQYGHSIGITNTASFLVRGSAQVIAVNDDELIIGVKKGDTSFPATMAMEYVYGNTIRDASGLVDIREFTNTMDLNNISEELNRMVRTSVVPPFRTAVKQGSIIEWTGAIELNKEHLKLDKPEIIPVQLKIIQ